MDSEPLHYQAFVMVGRSLGFEMTFEQYMQVYIGFDDRDAFRIMLDAVGEKPTPGRVAELCAQKQPAFEAVTQAKAAAGNIAVPGAVALLDAAKAAGWPVAIASGATRADIDLMLGVLDREEAFEVIVTADDVEHSKPDPATYAKAVAALGLEPGQCMAIEDTAAGLRSAKGAGLHTLGLTTTHTPEQLSAADHVVTSLVDVDLDWLNKHFPAEL